MDENEVVGVLRSFFEAMGRWEADSKALYRKARKEEVEYDDVKRETLEELQKVFGKYCIFTGRPARAKFGAPNVSMIPTYGPNLEDVLSIEVSGDRAVVLTKQRTGPKFQLRYSLVKLADGWRIEDNRKSSIRTDERATGTYKNRHRPFGLMAGRPLPPLCRTQ